MPDTPRVSPNAITFAIAEYERDRELTVRQLAAVEFVNGMGAYRDKFTAQLTRIDQQLAQLRGRNDRR